MAKFTKNNVEKKNNKEKKLISSRDMITKRKYYKKKIQKQKFLSFSEKQEIIETIQQNIKQDLYKYIDKRIFQQLTYNKKYTLNYQEQQNITSNLLNDQDDLKPHLMTNIINDNLASIEQQQDKFYYTRLGSTENTNTKSDNPQLENLESIDEMNSEEYIKYEIDEFQTKFQEPLLPTMTDEIESDTSSNSDMFYDPISPKFNSIYCYEPIPIKSGSSNGEQISEFDIEAQHNYSITKEPVLSKSTIYERNYSFEEKNEKLPFFQQ